MSWFSVNKGVGRAVEVKGLRAQYFIYAVAGVVVAFVIFFLLSFFINQVAATLIAATCLMVNISICFFLNKKFGENGFVQLIAKKKNPSRIAFHKRFYKIISISSEN